MIQPFYRIGPPPKKTKILCRPCKILRTSEILRKRVKIMLDELRYSH